MMRFLQSKYAPLMALVAARLVMFLRVPTASEDAFITFRYARNLADGHGLVFNLGERVMGYTSPLWTTIMAFPFLTGIDPVAFSRTVLLGCDVGALLVAWRLLGGGASARTFGWFFALWPFWSGVTASGIEMPLVVLLVLAAAERPRWWTLALLAISRPEGAVMAAVISLWAPMRVRLTAVAACIPVAASLWLYYGSVIPNSVTAKAASYGVAGPLRSWQWWGWLVGGINTTSGDVVHAAFIGFVVLAGMAAGAASLWVVRRGCVAAAVAAPLMIWLCYVCIGAAYFWWYMAIPFLAAGLMASVGLPRMSRGWAIPAAILALIALNWGQMSKLYRGRAQAEGTMVRAAEYLRTNASQNQSLMAEAVGHLGFISRLRIVDQVGIVSKAPARKAGWMGVMVREHDPDYIAMRRMELAGKDFAGGQPAFLSPADRESTLSRYATYREAVEHAAKSSDNGAVYLLEKWEAR